MNPMDDLEVEREIANLALNDNDAEQQHVEHLAHQNPAAQNPQLPHVNDPAAQNDLQLPGNPAAENEPPPAENPAAQNENQNENQLQNDDQNENLPQNGDPVENEQEIRPRGARGGNKEKRKFFREKLNPYHRNLENLATFQAMLVSASTRATRSEQEKRRSRRNNNNNTENKG